jgi:prostaglandin-H2 D-isomerase / glutathione transferase
MSKVKLIYFSLTGRAFAMRVALNLAKEKGAISEFVDERLTFPEWREKKDSLGLPLGQLPIIDIDGKVFCQSTALARWAGKISGLYPSDELQALKVDEFIAAVDEIWSRTPRGGDDLAAKRAAWVAEWREKYLPFLTARLAESEGPFLLGKEISIADLFFFPVLDAAHTGFWDHVPKDSLTEGFPSIAWLYSSVKDHELYKLGQ